MPVQIPSSCHRSRIKTTHSKPAVHLGIKDVKMWSQDLQGQKFWGSFVKFWVFRDLQNLSQLLSILHFKFSLVSRKGFLHGPDGLLYLMSESCYILLCFCAMWCSEFLTAERHGIVRNETAQPRHVFWELPTGEKIHCLKASESRIASIPFKWKSNCRPSTARTKDLIHEKWLSPRRAIFSAAHRQTWRCLK